MVTDGKVDAELFNVERRRTTNEVYPQQELPSMKAINDWKKAMRAAFIHGDMGIGHALIERTAEGDSTEIELQHYIQAQPHYVRQIMGQQCNEWSDDDTADIVEAMREGRVVTIFGDGSVKDGRGSHA